MFKEFIYAFTCILWHIILCRLNEFLLISDAFQQSFVMRLVGLMKKRIVWTRYPCAWQMMQYLFVRLSLIRLSIFIQDTAAVLFAVLIGMQLEWRITLVALATIPILAVSAVAQPLL